MRKLILKHFLSPGDVLMLTATVRDLHQCYPGQFLTDVRTPCPELWESNPFITSLDECDPSVEVIDCHYDLINRCNQLPYHFIHGFRQFLNEKLALQIRPTAFKGDVYISETEKSWISQVEEIAGEDTPFWLVVAGGKYDFTAKWWDAERFQRVIDYYRGRLLFVQVGEECHYHPPLSGVLDLRGKTDLRQLIRLVYHAQGVLCPVTLLMHLSAAIEVKSGRPGNRPCVVIAGGREPSHWEAYTHHQFIHTNGALRCCEEGGCWKSRIQPLYDGDEKDRPENLCVDVVGKLPRCMDLITAEDVIRRIEMHFAGGALQYLAATERPTAERLLTNWKAKPASMADEQMRIKMNLRLDEPLTMENARVISEKMISLFPPYPETYAGRGIVIAAGGQRYFSCAWVCINMLRHFGCSLPVQVWYLGEKEFSNQMKETLAPLNVECIDAFEIRKKHPARTLNGWELKPYAILHCPFKEVIYLDADNVPLVDLTFLFDTPEFQATGAIFWPDFSRLEETRPIWRICGISFRDEPEFESGQIVIDKERCWKALRLCMWYNEHSDFFYDYVHGDKETFHLAFRKVDQQYSMPAQAIFALQGTMCQHDFAGNRIFQHRNLEKWSLFGENQRISGFLEEDRCLQFLADLRKLWNGRVDGRNFQLTSKPEPLRRLGFELVETLFVYERVGFDERPMSFAANGTIAVGSDACEIYWDLEQVQSETVLKIFSNDKTTCEFHKHDDGIWRGQWLHHERMPVQLRPLLPTEPTREQNAGIGASAPTTQMPKA